MRALFVSPSVATELLARLTLAQPSKRLGPVAEAAARHEGKAKRLFVKAAKVAQDAVPFSELVDVLSLGHPGTGAPLHVLEPAIVAWCAELMNDFAPPTYEHRPHMRTAAKKLPNVLLDAMSAGAKAKPLGMAFDVANPKAVEWATTQAAKLVTDVSTEARKAIRSVVTDGVEAGLAPRETATLIRTTIGLTERDASAVMKSHLALLADGVESEKALAKAERYSSQLLTKRAETIARTETMEAANEGQAQLWDQAVEAGLLDPSDAMKTWIASPDACPECAEVDGETVPMSDDFSVGDDPPLHPNCRCTIGLVG